MNHLGHISIQRSKIVFVYYELEKPKKENYSGKNMPYFDTYGYHQAMQEYQASRREAEVSNADSTFHGFEGSFAYVKIGKIKYTIKHNQPCEAEVNGKAVITKIL